MELLNVVDRIEALVKTSTRIPGTGRAMVDVARLVELLEQLRLAVPQDVRAAMEILSKKDKVLSLAHSEARKIRRSAEEEYHNRVENSEIIQAARKKANDIIADAQRRAKKIVDEATVQARLQKAEADAYAIQTLRSLEKQLNGVLTTVRRGIDTLAEEVEELQEVAAGGNGKKA